MIIWKHFILNRDSKVVLTFEINMDCMLKWTLNHFLFCFETLLLHLNRLFIKKLHCNKINAEFLGYHVTYFYQEFVLFFFHLVFFSQDQKKSLLNNFRRHHNSMFIAKQYFEIEELWTSTLVNLLKKQNAWLIKILYQKKALERLSSGSCVWFTGWFRTF